MQSATVGVCSITGTRSTPIYERAGRSALECVVYEIDRDRLGMNVGPHRQHATVRMSELSGDLRCGEPS